MQHGAVVPEKGRVNRSRAGARTRPVLHPLAAIGLVVTSSGPLVAQGAPETGGGGGTASPVELSLPVTASISGSCNFSSFSGGVVNVGEISDGFSRDVPFTTTCNTAFRVAIVSSNGGLLTADAARPGQSSLAAYNISLNLSGDAGATSSAGCAAAALAGSAAQPCALRGPASASTGLKLNGQSSGAISYLRLSAAPGEAGAGLVPSTGYRDTLTVSISPSP